MFKHIITINVLLFFFICPNYLFAQIKFEKESRLKEKDIPSIALDLIDALAVEKKVKWYLEEGFNQASIEAKFELNTQKYSIEFDTLGNLEDIEIQIKWNGLNKTLRDSIDFHLGQDCERYKIRKIQIQYSGESAALLHKIKTEDSKEDYITRYEVVVKCRSKNNVNLFEYLFSDSGQMLTVSQIIFKNSSHLEY
jgi:hypothetical protein